MKLLILGAAGKTGLEVTRQALQQDHTVSVLVHHADSFEDPGVDNLFTGDATDSALLDRALIGQEAVLDCIGGSTPYLHTELERSTATAVVAAMQRQRVRRLIVLSMLGEGHSMLNAPWAYQHLLYPTYLHGAKEDKAAMEHTVKHSGLDWVILRPAVLTDEPATGMVKVFLPGDDSKAHTITRGDLAAVMLDEIESLDHLHQALTLANE